MLKPILRGRDIRRYHARWCGLWLISTFPSKKLNITEYPAIERHLLSYGKDKLEQAGKLLPGGSHSRKKTPHKWYELQDTCAYHEQFEDPKLLWMHMSPEARFACVPAGIYCNQKAFMISGSCLDYFCAILNSNLSEWYIKHFAVTTGMGLTQWDKYVVEQIPVPDTDERTKTQITGLVKDRMGADSIDVAREIESTIDDIVADLYGLSDTDECVWNQAR